MKRMLRPEPHSDASASALPQELETAGLVYANDAEPGISRVSRGKKFSYQLPSGSPLKDQAALKRIRALAIPPAWTDVWICPSPQGHIQATGRDYRIRAGDRRSVAVCWSASSYSYNPRRLPLAARLINSSLPRSLTPRFSFFCARCRRRLPTLQLLLDDADVVAGYFVFERRASQSGNLSYDVEFHAFFPSK
jgi:hypothetical protein